MLQLITMKTEEVVISTALVVKPTQHYASDLWHFLAISHQCCLTGSLYVCDENVLTWIRWSAV